MFSAVVFIDGFSLNREEEQNRLQGDIRFFYFDHTPDRYQYYPALCNKCSMASTGEVRFTFLNSRESYM